MTWHLQKEIESLKKKILSLAAMVEEDVEKAVLSLRKKDEKLAQEVIIRDEEIDQIEVEVEEDCLKILALHQPVATDLRYVIAILKINNDLERIGDLAVTISEQSLFLRTYDNITIPFDFADMVHKTRSMLRRCIDSLVNLDVNLAREVCLSDSEVDKLHRDMYGQVQAAIVKQPDNIEGLFRYLIVSRSLERLADYATNISEDIIYMIEGRIVRHYKKEKDDK